MNSAGLCVASSGCRGWARWWRPNAAHNLGRTLITRLGMVPGLRDWRVDRHGCCVRTGVRVGRRAGAAGLQAFDDGLVPGLLAPPAEVLRVPWRAGVLAGRGDGLGRSGVWRLLRQGAGRHAE